MRQPQGRTTRILWQTLQARIPLIVSLALLMLGQTGATLVSPLLLKTLFDHAIPTRDITLIIRLLFGLFIAPMLALLLVGLREYRAQAWV